MLFLRHHGNLRSLKRTGPLDRDSPGLGGARAQTAQACKRSPHLLSDTAKLAAQQAGRMNPVP
jgi:hypothetical protein